VTEQQRSPEEIREDIVETREELGDTAAALAQKADVKSQAKARVKDAKQKASARAESIKETATEKKEQFAGKTQEVTPDSAATALDGARRFARENPAVVGIGAALAVGFLLGRRRGRR
jgi:ElaB/YqjD/DUF883 family membrane-anchored ribosome-binding protein